jgi:hypothetical protein
MNIDTVISLDFDWDNEIDFKLALFKNKIFHEEDIWTTADSVYGYFEARPNQDQITQLVEVLKQFEIINDDECKTILATKPTCFHFGGVI